MNAGETLEPIVQYAFASIMTKYGYCLVECDDSYARLDSCHVSIGVHYDRRRSFEVGVEFSELESGRLARQISFNLGEIYRECGVPDADRASFFQSCDLRAVQRFLTSAAHTLLTHCGRALAGEHSFFEAVNRRRSAESAAYTRQVQLQSVRAKADEAWCNKKFQEFVDLLETFRNVLPASDRRKLDYARQKLLER